MYHKCLILLAIACAGFPSAAEQARSVTVLAEEFWPYSYTPDTATALSPTGIAIEFASELLTAAELEFELELLPWARVMKHIREDPNQLAITMARSPEREPLFHWIGSIATIDHALYAMKTEGVEPPTTLEEARSKSVTGVVGDIAHDYLVREGFENILTTSSYLKGLELLVRGRVDLYPGNTALIDYQCERVAGGCGDIQQVLSLSAIEQELYFVLSLDTDEQTVQRLRETFADLVENGRLEAIKRRYFGSANEAGAIH